MEWTGSDRPHHLLNPTVATTHVVYGQNRSKNLTLICCILYYMDLRRRVHVVQDVRMYNVRVVYFAAILFALNFKKANYFYVTIRH